MPQSGSELQLCGAGSTLATQLEMSALRAGQHRLLGLSTTFVPSAIPPSANLEELIWLRLLFPPLPNKVLIPFYSCHLLSPELSGMPRDEGIRALPAWQLDQTSVSAWHAGRAALICFFAPSMVLAHGRHIVKRHCWRSGSAAPDCSWVADPADVAQAPPERKGVYEVLDSGCLSAPTAPLYLRRSVSKKTRDLFCKVGH